MAGRSDSEKEQVGVEQGPPPTYPSPKMPSLRESLLEPLLISTCVASGKDKTQRPRRRAFLCITCYYLLAYYDPNRRPAAARRPAWAALSLWC
jgi:hypothetical protein